MERYRPQIKNNRLPQAYGQNFVDGAAAGVQVAGAWGRLGETIQKAGEVMKRQQDEWDATRAMEANNEFMKRMTAYMDDPDKGIVNTRKLGLAQGVTKQADTDFDGFVSEIEATLDNDAQKQAFRAMAERSRVPFWKQASHFEAAQVREYRGQVFKTTLDAGMQMTMRDPMDEGAFETAAVQGATAIRAQYVGADEKVVKAAIDEYVSSLEAARIAAVSEGNPLLGEALIKSSPYLTPMDAKKLRASITPKAEIYRRQEAVDELVQRFGPGQEQEGLAWIRANKGGEEEERLASAYKQRIGEMTIREVNADAELRKQQAANFDQLYKDYWSQGNNVPQEQLDAMLQNNVISSAQHRQATAWNRTAVTRADVTRKLSKSPDWSSLTPQQQEERIMRGMGVTKEDREAALVAIQAGVLDGTMTDAELNAYYKSGAITGAELERFKKIDTQVSREQKSFVSDQRKALSTDMDGLKIPGKDDKLYRNIALNKFNELVSQLDPNSKTYRMDVMDARRAAMMEAVQSSGKKQADGWFFGFGAEEPTSFGKRVSQALTALEEQTGRVEEYAPSFQTDEIDLSQNSGNVGQNNIGGRTPPVRGETPEMNVIIDEAASEFGVDPDLVRAVIKQESGWKPKAVSHAGAQGLMQLMPKTAKGLGVTDSFDIRQNIRGGTKLLGQLLRQYNGDIEKALAAYNAGPPRANQDRSTWPKETKRYVPAVLSHYKNIKQGKDKGQSAPTPTSTPTPTPTPAPTPAQPKGPAMMNGVQLGPTREAAAKLAQQEGKEPIDSILFGGKDGI